MKYIAVQWHHDHPDEPIELLSELDESGWELRKVEVYADGRRDFADPNEQTGETRLSVELFPPLHEIGADPQFSPREISREDFEDVWNRATGRVARP